MWIGLAPQICNMALSVQCLIMTKKDVLCHVLESSEVLQKSVEKSLLKQALEEKIQTFYDINKESLFLFISLHVITRCFTVLSCSVW